MKPQITTIIPTYRRPKLLRRAIQSVLNQTYSEFQVCVYDNASGDETAEVVRSLATQDSRIHYYCHKEDVGWLRNFDFAMRQVKTPWFSILSDDDVLLPRFFETAVDHLSKYSEAMFFAGLIIPADNTGRVLHVSMAKWREGLYRPPEAFFEMLTKGHPDWTGVVFNRRLLDVLGGLDAAIGGPADLDFELRAAARFAGVISHTPCAIFFTHPGTETTANGLQHLWEGTARIARKIRTDPQIPLSLRHDLSAAADRRFARQIRRHATELAFEGKTAACLAETEILSKDFGWQKAARFIEIMAHRAPAGAAARMLYRTTRAGYRAIRWPDRSLVALRSRRETQRARREMIEYQALVREALCDISPEDFYRVSSQAAEGVPSAATSA